MKKMYKGLKIALMVLSVVPAIVLIALFSLRSRKNYVHEDELN